MYSDAAIELLNTKFVCFSPGWYINTKDETYQAAWGRFYRSKPLPTEGSGWLQGTQLVMMTSAGRLLQGLVKGKDGMAPALREVLDAYAKLPEAERRPEKVEGEVKPQPPPPADGLVLTIYDRPLGRGETGEYRLPRGTDLGGRRTEASGGQRSSLWLKAEEVASLLPPDPVKGQARPVPSKLARRIWLYGLVPQTLWVVEGTWAPDSVREGDLSLTVEDVTPEKLRMRVHGSVLMIGMSGHPGFENLEKRYDARLEGVIEVDRAAKKITRFDLVALGDYTGEWFTGHERWKAATPELPLAMAFAVEIDRTSYGLPPERRRPRSFMHAYIFNEREPQFWDPDLWLADWEKKRKK
jgi:hypothetical protein